MKYGSIFVIFGLLLDVLHVCCHSIITGIIYLVNGYGYEMISL